jgi:hypothetical protein
VTSDTGELARNWKEGIETIDTPRTQAVNGWVGGKTLELKDASFAFSTEKAFVALSSVDNQTLTSSRFILVTAVAQARPGRTPDSLPFLSQPVVGKVRLRTELDGLELLALGPDGKVVGRTVPPREGDALTLSLPAARGTHWYVLRAGAARPAGQPEPQPAKPPGSAPHR